MIILQWVVWALASLLALVSLWHLRKNARDNKPVHIIEVLNVLLDLLLPIIFLFSSWNKLHLIWIFPAALVLSLAGFIIFRIPIIGTLLRKITLFFGWIFLLGTGDSTTITGVLHGK